MNITLTPEQETFIQSQVEQGKYETVEQLLSEALRLLAERDCALVKQNQNTALVEEFKQLLKETQALHADNPLTEEEIAAEIEAYRRGE